MRLKNRVMVIISASLASLTIMGLFGLYTMRQSVMEEREAQIVQLLDFADSQLRYFHALELNGHMNREVAQARAMEAISAQRQDSNYFFIRSLTGARRPWRCASSLAAMNCVRASFSRRTIVCW